MAEVRELSDEEILFLKPYLPPDDFSNVSRDDTPISDFRSSRSRERADLPFVTLTYASSLDSMIALAPGARTTLSGPETKSMTHYLRFCHDAILVGVGTAAIDDPGLNCRYPGAGLSDQPRPMIVDPKGRWEVTGKKVCRLAAEGAGKAPWVITAPQANISRATLQNLGGDYVHVQNKDHDSSLAWQSILRAMKQRGINSVMIEGGATVINTLLAMPNLVDVVIVTIAPTFLGRGGVAVSPVPRSQDGQPTNAAWIQHAVWKQFGADVVLCGNLRQDG